MKTKQPDKNNTDGYSGFLRFVAISSFVFLILIIFSQDGILRYIGSRLKIRSQHSEIERYQREIEKMDEDCRILSTDRDSLERYARERFHFAAPGEDVYLTD